MSLTNRNEAGLLADTAQLYGMEAFTLDQLTVLEGDLSALYEPGSHAIAAVYTDDDYGNPRMDSHWARLGDTHHPAVCGGDGVRGPGHRGELRHRSPEDGNYREVPKTYRDVTYEVAALVTVPNSLDYGYYGGDEFVLNSETFCRDTGTNCVMSYAFNTTDEGNAAMEAFLQDYTENQNPQLDYESRATFAGGVPGLPGDVRPPGRGPELHRGPGGGAELLQRHPHRHPHPPAGVRCPSVHRHDRAAAKGNADLGGVFYALSAVVFGAGLVLAMAPPHGVGGDVALVLHLPPHPGAGGDLGPHLPAAGLPDPPGGVPVGHPGLPGGAVRATED